MTIQHISAAVITLLALGLACALHALNQRRRLIKAQTETINRIRRERDALRNQSPTKSRRPGFARRGGGKANHV